MFGKRDFDPRRDCFRAHLEAEAVDHGHRAEVLCRRQEKTLLHRAEIRRAHHCLPRLHARRFSHLVKNQGPRDPAQNSGRKGRSEHDAVAHKADIRHRCLRYLARLIQHDDFVCAAAPRLTQAEDVIEVVARLPSRAQRIQWIAMQFPCKR